MKNLYFIVKMSNKPLWISALGYPCEGRSRTNIFVLFWLNLSANILNKVEV